MAQNPEALYAQTNHCEVPRHLLDCVAGCSEFLVNTKP